VMRIMRDVDEAGTWPVRHRGPARRARALYGSRPNKLANIRTYRFSTRLSLLLLRFWSMAQIRCLFEIGALLK